MTLPDGNEVILIHLLINDVNIACTHGIGVLHATNLRPFPLHRTMEVNAVTCQLCKNTDEYKSAKRFYDTREIRVVRK